MRDAVARVLTYEGYRVTAAVDGTEALDYLEKETPDAVVMDVMMPNIDGLTACRMMRSKHRDLPILLLTARHEIGDRVAGLDAGADDYLVKPFALDELLARLRALLRRTSVSETTTKLVVADLELDPQRRTALRNGRDLDLTKTEFDLLELLMVNAGIVLLRDVIYERIWGYNFETGSRSLDVHVGYLRRKTEVGDESRLVHTVRGVGYVVREG